MLLAVDVGNTSSVIGLFDGEDLAAEWRIATRYRTTDELEVVLRGLLAARQIRPDAITSGCLSTTVPPVQGAWEEVLQRVAGTAPVVIEPGVRTGVAVRVQNPREVGPDRIANAAAAAALHGAPAIVVDFGTATNFDGAATASVRARTRARLPRPPHCATSRPAGRRAACSRANSRAWSLIQWKVAVDS
ncbi:MAG: type III pantothenate kinase, partial [Actinomycetota bacterium]